MEFDEVKNIWQNQKVTSQVTNDDMTEMIQRFSTKSGKTIQRTEKWLIIIFSFTALTTLVEALIDRESLRDTLETVLLWLIPVIIVVLRKKRIAKTLKFDESMMGNLDRAITNTRSLIILANLLLWGLVVPLFLFHLYKYWQQADFTTPKVFVLIMFLISLLLIGWELLNVHLPKKRKLLDLKRKILSNEE